MATMDRSTSMEPIRLNFRNETKVVVKVMVEPDDEAMAKAAYIRRGASSLPPCRCRQFLQRLHQPQQQPPALFAHPLAMLLNGVGNALVVCTRPTFGIAGQIALTVGLRLGVESRRAVVVGRVGHGYCDLPT